jgi:hypothetical protein
VKSTWTSLTLSIGSEVHDIFTSGEDLSEVAATGLINYYDFDQVFKFEKKLEELKSATPENSMLAMSFA